jgi:hypothetical protein
MDANEAIFKRILDDPDFKAAIGDYYVRRLYGRLREETESYLEVADAPEDR